MKTTVKSAALAASLVALGYSPSVSADAAAGLIMPSEHALPAQDEPHYGISPIPIPDPPEPEPEPEPEPPADDD